MIFSVDLLKKKRAFHEFKKILTGNRMKLYWIGKYLSKSDTKQCTLCS